MNKSSICLTVFFEDPFWVGVFERQAQGELTVCKVTFGAEPKDGEVYDFVLRNYASLRFSPAGAAPVKAHAENPKRAQRQARGQIHRTGIGTKAQQALKLQQEQLKTERQTQLRQQRGQEKENRFALKQKQRKAKHRGK